MRSLVISLFAALLLGACRLQRPAPASQASKSSEPQSDYWRKVEAMSKYQQEADVVLEAEALDRFRLLKPTAAADQSAVGLEAYLHLIPVRAPSSGLAVLIIPELEIVQGTQKIMDEVILDVRDVATK